MLLKPQATDRGLPLGLSGSHLPNAATLYSSPCCGDPPAIELLTLLLHNCSFVTVMDQIFWAIKVSQRGHDQQVEKCCLGIYASLGAWSTKVPPPFLWTA